MKITNEFLDEKSKRLACLIPKEDAVNANTTLLTSHEYTVALMCDCEQLEVIRLARLGLWAEEHGVPALRWYADKANHDGAFTHDGCETNANADSGERARNALAALPDRGENG